LGLPRGFETLGLEMAELVFKREGKPFTDAQRTELDELAVWLLQAAGKTKVGKIPVPPKVETVESIPAAKPAASVPASASTDEAKAS
jgi:hypothetical protein